MLETSISITLWMMLISPAISLYQLIKKGPTDVISPIQFIMGIVVSSLWLRYGFLTKNTFWIRNHSVVVVICIIYVAVFWIFAKNKAAVLKKVFALMSLVALTILLLSFFPEGKQRHLMGTVCSTVTLLGIASPLLNVGQVFRKKTTENLPFVMIFVAFLLSLQRFLYAHLTNDIYIKIPSTFGASVGLFQLSLFWIYPPQEKLKEK